MKKKQKTKALVLKVIFSIIATFTLMVIFVPLITPSANAAKIFVDFVNLFTKIQNHIKDLAIIYALLFSGLIAGYYFLVYKPKIK